MMTKYSTRVWVLPLLERKWLFVSMALFLTSNLLSRRELVALTLGRLFSNLCLTLILCSERHWS